MLGHRALLLAASLRHVQQRPKFDQFFHAVSPIRLAQPNPTIRSILVRAERKWNPPFSPMTAAIRSHPHGATESLAHVLQRAIGGRSKPASWMSVLSTSVSTKRTQRSRSAENWSKDFIGSIAHVFAVIAPTSLHRHECPPVDGKRSFSYISGRGGWSSPKPPKRLMTPTVNSWRWDSTGVRATARWLFSCRLPLCRGNRERSVSWTTSGLFRRCGSGWRSSHR
jgi:hypothetical protein